MQSQITERYALSQAQKLGTTVVLKPAEKSAAGASRFLTPVISTKCLPITKPRGEGPYSQQDMCDTQHVPACVGDAEGHSSTQALPASCLC